MTPAMAVSVVGLLLLAPPARPAEIPTFSASVETVRVDVLVTDGHRAVVGLDAEDFEVRDNGVLQRVELASFETLPVSVMLALDTSGSVSGERLKALRAASRAILGALGPGDSAGLLTFSSGLSLRTGLTTDVGSLNAALQEWPVSGATALVNATQAALVIGESERGRGLVILLSDGVDTSSFLRPESVLETAQRSDAVVYGVSVSPLPRSSFVRQVCDATGGRVLSAGSSSGIRQAFLRVFEEFRQRYLLSYSPQGVGKRGWHELRVRVRNRRGVEVEARPGYLGGP